MVLFRSRGFRNRNRNRGGLGLLGLDVHVRTEFAETRGRHGAKFSFIRNVAIRIGGHSPGGGRRGDIFEVEALDADDVGDNGEGAATYLNGEAIMVGHRRKVDNFGGGDYTIKKSKQGRKGLVLHYDLNLGGDKAILIRVRKHIVSVDIKGHWDAETYEGMLGSSAPAPPGLVARNGTSLDEYWEDFGQSWAVNPPLGDADLFRERGEGPHFPELCRYELAPSAVARRSRGRRLGAIEEEGEPVSHDRAVEVCAIVPDEHKRIWCQMDVRSMSDETIVEDEFYWA